MPMILKRPEPPPPPAVYPPKDLLTAELNVTRVKKIRHSMVTDEYTIHVSDLIKTDPAYEFCAREQALHYFENKPFIHTGMGITPAMELLFAMGNALHDKVRDEFMRRSPHADKAWGVWKCPCQEHTFVGLRNRDSKCKHCGKPALQYHEYSIRLPKLRIVGHPDFLTMWDGWIEVTEIKSIERSDVNFDTLDAPLGNHLLQASMYGHMLRDLGFNVLPTGRFIYATRDSSRLFKPKSPPYKEFQVRLSSRLRVQRLFDKANGLQTSIAKRALPPRICKSATSIRAKNCAVCTSCFSRIKDTV